MVPTSLALNIAINIIDVVISLTPNLKDDLLKTKLSNYCRMLNV